jgi:hypothetical protein
MVNLPEKGMYIRYRPVLVAMRQRPQSSGTARKIALTGAVTGSGSFDGSGDLSIETTSAAVGTRVWLSGEYTPVQNTPTIVNHGISGLNPLYARCEVLLKCVTAEYDYAVGDFSIGWLPAQLLIPVELILH